MSWNDRIDGLKKKRMLLGECEHGIPNLETNPRDFIEEGIEELVDFLNYVKFASFMENFRSANECRLTRISDLSFFNYSLWGMVWGITE